MMFLVHDRYGNSFLSVANVRRTLVALAYGPKYLAPSDETRRVT